MYYTGLSINIKKGHHILWKLNLKIYETSQVHFCNLYRAHIFHFVFLSIFKVVYPPTTCVNQTGSIPRVFLPPFFLCVWPPPLGSHSPWPGTPGSIIVRPIVLARKEWPHFLESRFLKVVGSQWVCVDRCSLPVYWYDAQFFVGEVNWERYSLSFISVISFLALWLSDYSSSSFQWDFTLLS